MIPGVSGYNTPSSEGYSRILRMCFHSSLETISPCFPCSGHTHATTHPFCFPNTSQLFTIPCPCLCLCLEGTTSSHPTTAENILIFKTHLNQVRSLHTPAPAMTFFSKAQALSLSPRSPQGLTDTQ